MGQLTCQLNIIMLRSKLIRQTFIYYTAGDVSNYRPKIHWSLSV